MQYENIKPWDRQKNETDKSYSAFRLYLAQNERSLQKVAESLHKDPTLIRRWSSKFKWRERAAAWDSSLLEEERKKKSDELKERIERRKKIGLMLQARATGELQKKDLSKTGVKSLIEMLIAGLDFENSAVDLENAVVNGSDIEDLTIIELPEKEKKI